MSELLPGFRDGRLVKLMRDAIERCQLDLSGTVVLTEAASGAYVVTPVLAAMAGSHRVFAVTRPSRYGSVHEITTRTCDLARVAGVRDRISILASKYPDIVGQADLITNSGHLRPIDEMTVSWMKPTAVVPLMYEAWEYRSEDVDLIACRRRGILVAGTNERHPAVDVFSYLGVLAVKLLLDAGIAVSGCKILLCCDNSFRTFIESGLIGQGAIVDVVCNLRNAVPAHYDVLFIAMRPRGLPVVGAEDVNLIAQQWPGALVAQFWGDLDREALTTSRVPYWPLFTPALGHMGILPSAIGPEPIVRLQAGGLKVGEALMALRNRGTHPDLTFIDELDSAA